MEMPSARLPKQRLPGHGLPARDGYSLEPMELTGTKDDATAPPPHKTETTVGNVFISNYPPYSFWTPEHVPSVLRLLDRPPSSPPALGIYAHIPFCRKRCDFCYYKVYTDKNSQDVHRYLAAMIDEIERYARQPYLRDRLPRFVYFGGGTPSYLSVEQLERLFEGMRRAFPWDAAEEITFECEPGTLQESKIKALKDLGVTRLSLGVENFDADLLELNNRAHRAKEIFRAYEYAREVGFDQINIDLIAGMVGETDKNWKRCIEQTLALKPDSVTIYQMEIPYNTTIYQRMMEGGKEVAPVADWQTKRRWTAEAFAEMEKHGFIVGSAYTVKNNDRVQFQYRDALWTGADLLPIGVSSFGHFAGVHLQNEHRFEDYVARVEKGELPILRALPLTAEEKLIRQFILLIKLGRLDAGRFRRDFGVDVLERFAAPLRSLVEEGVARIEGDVVTLSRDGLLKVDSFLPRFFLPQHQNARYA